jgi:hypothetical protein
MYPLSLHTDSAFAVIEEYAGLLGIEILRDI